MRILIITSARFADAVNCTGVIEQLRLQHRHARFTIACGASSGSLFGHFPNLERLVLIDKGNRDFRQFHVWRKLVTTSWDLTIDIRGSEITRFMLSSQRIIIKGDRAARQYKPLSSALGISPPPLPHIWTIPADHDEAERLLPKGAPIIGLCPTAAENRKIWPAERYVELFRQLAKTIPGARAAVFASPSDSERYVCAEVVSALPGAINLGRNLALPLLAACSNRLALLIGNDSGMPHISAAAGTPTLSLFTSPRSDRFAPVGPHTAAITATTELIDRPMEALTVDTVLAAAQKLLQYAKAPSP